jgi:hypothetical protein
MKERGTRDGKLQPMLFRYTSEPRHNQASLMIALAQEMPQGGSARRYPSNPFAIDKDFGIAHVKRRAICVRPALVEPELREVLRRRCAALKDMRQACSTPQIYPCEKPRETDTHHRKRRPSWPHGSILDRI